MGGDAMHSTAWYKEKSAWRKIKNAWPNLIPLNMTIHDAWHDTCLHQVKRLPSCAWAEVHAAQNQYYQ